MIDDISETYCIDCFHNKGVKAWFKHVGENSYCGYCQKQSSFTAPIDDFCEFFVQCISTKFSTPDNESMSYCTREGGWLGKTYETYDIIEAADLETNDAIRLEPIDNYLLDISWLWCDRDHRELSESERLSFDWKQFKEIVIHRARYVFLHALEDGYTEHHGQPYNVNTILNEIGELVSSHKLLQSIPCKTRLYRTRIPKAGEKLSTYEQLCAPEWGKAIYPNRMSPAGISMFYGALDQNTAYQEIYDPEKPPNSFVSATFTTEKDMYVVDFTSLPSYPELVSLDTNSIYDHSSHERLIFLYKFVHSLAKPIEKNRLEHIEYVPTQIITEYLRFIYLPDVLNGKKVMGIIYNSAVSEAGKCIVLFVDPPSKNWSDRNTKKWLKLSNTAEIKTSK